uniref:GIT1_C domain-containing protein n=1 Tax=Macrostomum lignano TaxID=282301 RepID=A0A1I8FFX3_9PLAT
MNARLAEENRQLRQRLTSLWPSAGRLADSADAAAASIAGVVSIAQQFIGPPPPLLLSSPMSAACMARPTPVVPAHRAGVVRSLTKPQLPKLEATATAKAKATPMFLTPVGQQLDINVDEEEVPPPVFSSSAATAVDDGDADYDQPPAETDEEDNEMCNERRPPTQEEVVARTEAITSEIYKMLEAARSGSPTIIFLKQSRRVRQAVLAHDRHCRPGRKPHQRQAVDALLTARGHTERGVPQPAQPLGAEPPHPAGHSVLLRHRQGCQSSGDAV